MAAVLGERAGQTADRQREVGREDQGNPGMAEGSSDGHEVGHRRPPKTTRFPRGVSGNPRGRPKGRKSELPHEAVLGRMVKIRKDGREQQVTIEEAFLLHIGKAGMDGDGAAARATLAVIERARNEKAAADYSGTTTIEVRIVALGSVSTALEALRMARRLDAYR